MGVRPNCWFENERRSSIFRASYGTVPFARVTVGRVSAVSHEDSPDGTLLCLHPSIPISSGVTNDWIHSDGISCDGWFFCSRWKKSSRRFGIPCRGIVLLVVGNVPERRLKGRKSANRNPCVATTLQARRQIQTSSVSHSFSQQSTFTLPLTLRRVRNQMEVPMACC